MGNYQQRDLSGSLFKNEEKREGKNDADYNGTAVINGRAFWVNAWIKRPEGKQTFLSLSFKPKQAPAARTQEERRSKPIAQRPPPSDPDLDSETDGIPF